MKEILSSPPNIANITTNKDTVVIWGGTRDIGWNESNQALKQIKNFVQSYSNTNIIVISVPCRYDVDQKSCVNEEVEVFNRKLCKHLKAFNNTQMVEGGSNRDYYTRHGLHLNQKGKEQMARNIAWAIKDRLNVQNVLQS